MPSRSCRLLFAALLATVPLRAAPTPSANCASSHGGITRGPTDARRLALVFTGDAFAEGAATILAVLASREVKAAFFLTGGFLRHEPFEPLVRRMLAAGHLTGPHSDRHLLYADWENRDRTLVSEDQFRLDLKGNLRELERFGVSRIGLRYFVPPYEWYNREVAAWSAKMGLRIFTFTPGTRANADYTGEADANFISSEAIVRSVLERERQDPHGLNGFVLLLHLGAGEGRRDKMHARLDELIGEIARRGYTFARVDELLESCR